MTIENIPNVPVRSGPLSTTSPASRTGGRPVGSRGNGKTQNEKIARAKRNFEVEKTEIAIEAERAQIAVLRAVEKRKEEQQARVDKLYNTQESKRAPQMQIDQPVTLWVLVGLAIITFLATALLTADGTIGAAAAARFATDWMGFVVFGVFEVATLAFMLMYYVRGSRIDIITGKQVNSSQWFVAMVFASIITVGLSAYHVLDLYDYDIANIDVWVGIGIRVTASLFFVLISKGIAGVLFAKAIPLDA